MENHRDIEMANVPLSQADKDQCACEIKNALEVLRKGGVILYPTDTVWGLGCDASNSEAVKRLFDIKNRPEAKSMLVLVGSEAMLDRTVQNIPEVAWDLAELAVDPLTIIYDEPKGVAPELLAEDGSLGIRLTRDYFSSQLCGRLRKPIVSTSANISGVAPPHTFEEIPEEIRNAADYVVDWRRDDNTPHAPSAIIKLSNSGIVKIIR